MRRAWTLNSNLILLIQAKEAAMSQPVITFKFQSDSINTLSVAGKQAGIKPLNSNLILLIPKVVKEYTFIIFMSLNSNLILLIRMMPSFSITACFL